MAAASTLIRHDIAVSNVIYGVAHFLTLRLPEAWELAPGVSHPEVTAVHKRKGRHWIAAGRAWYVLYHRELGWAMELHIASRHRRYKPRARADGGERGRVHEHPAEIRRWTQRRGVFRPRTITFVEVTLVCEESGRCIRLELSGRCPPEGFADVARSMPEWRCH
jgi:hypothetical protein